MVPQPSEGGRFSTSVSGVERFSGDGSGRRRESDADADTGWKSRLRFPSKKKKEEPEPEAEDAAAGATFRDFRKAKGKTGASGATILTLYKGPTKDGLFTGTIAHGSFKAKSLGGPLKGKTIDDLVGMIEANDVYLSIGTQTHPDGEIRGQLQ